MLDSAWMMQAAASLILLILSLTVHEFAHAWMAFRLGDDTAARAGRLTLNPVPHIDPIGTILLPLLNAPIGWAKPVPTDVSRVRRGLNPSLAELMIAGVGPLANLLLAVVAAVALGVLARFLPGVVENRGVVLFLVGLMRVNAALCVFNLLPIPPLDGGHIAAYFVPLRMRPAWDTFARFAPLALLVLLVFGRGLPFLSVPINFVFGAVQRLAFAIA